MAYPIIDTHIHLIPANLPTEESRYPENLTLIGDLATPANFNLATLNLDRVRGYIICEAARAYDLTAGPAGWAGPLSEITYMRSVVEDPEHRGKVLGLIPWAPIPSGREAVEEYLKLAEERAGEVAWRKVKGFRFLAQDAEKGVQVTEEYIEGVKVLGEKGFVVEVGVDHHRRGKKMLDETLEMINKAHEGVEDDKKATFVINHLGKPDLHIVNPADKKFQSWRTALYSLSLCSKTYVQISGLFSEMPASLRSQSANDIFMAVFPWLSVLLATFGADRLIFASDWPVCVVHADGVSWVKWKEVVERLCYMATMSQEDQAKLFGGNAKRVFGLDVDLAWIE